MRTATHAAEANAMAVSARGRVRVLRPYPMATFRPCADGWSQIAFHTSADGKTGRPRRIGESP